MRPGIIAIVLLLLLAMAILIFKKSEPGSRSSTHPTSSESNSFTATATLQTQTQTHFTQPSNADYNATPKTADPSLVVTSTNAGPKLSGTVAEQIEKLETLAMNDDPVSLSTILSALTDSNPEIRAAARDAAVQFGDASASSALRAAAAVLPDIHEKSDLLESADYLDLPSYADNLNSNRFFRRPAPAQP